MQAYKYQGYDTSGVKVNGEILATSIEEAERRISTQDVTIIAIIPAGMKKGEKGAQQETGRASQNSSLKGNRKVSDADAAMVLRNLSVMAETGVPFIDALDAVIESARTPAIAAALRTVKSEVIGGKGLSWAMRSAPNMFPLLVSDMVKVAEEGGRLDTALASAATYLERAADLRKKIINAMLYPLVMLSVSFITVLILIVFVMPRFSDIFTKMKADIPITTKILLSTGTFIRGNPLYALLAVVGAVIGIRLLLKMPVVTYALSRFLLRVPVLGELLKKLALSRAFQSISTLLKGNVSLLTAIGHGANVAGNKLIYDALMNAQTVVEHGGNFSDALKESKVFPVMLIQMVGVGERTGRLAQLLSTTASSMEEEVDARLKAMVSIVEPIMIVLMGLIVGTITISIISPIYSVVQNIK